MSSRFRWSTIAIVAFWLYLLIDSFVQGHELPQWVRIIDIPDLPTPVVAVLLILIFCASLGGAFWQRKNLMEEMPVISDFCDRRFGKDSYQNFCRRLRPISASMVSSLILGATGLYAAHTGDGTPAAFLLCYGFLAFGFALLGARLLSRCYPPRLF
jgi:hypothetical protein